MDSIGICNGNKGVLSFLFSVFPCSFRIENFSNEHKSIDFALSAIGNFENLLFRPLDFAMFENGFVSNLGKKLRKKDKRKFVALGIH